MQRREKLVPATDASAREKKYVLVLFDEPTQVSPITKA